MTNPTPIHPTEIFRHLIITFLTPMFLAAAGGDITYARLAATETVAAYTARNPTDLLPIAQVIAFGLATLDSLNRSMAETLSTSLVLRLRANAASLNRAAEQCRRALSTPIPQAAVQDTSPEADHQHEAALIAGLAHTEQRLAQAKADLPTAEPPATPQPAAKPPTPTTEAHRTAWASAMTNVAREFTADLANLPPPQRREATLRATVVSSVAQQLLSNDPLPPSLLDARSHR